MSLGVFSLLALPRIEVNKCNRLVSTVDTAGGRLVQNSDLMIRLPILEDELAFLEKLLPDLETRPDLGHLANERARHIFVPASRFGRKLPIPKQATRTSPGWPQPSRKATM